MKRFLFAILALTLVAVSVADAHGPRVVRQRFVGHGAHAFIGGAAFRSFGYGHVQAFAQPCVTASIVQPFQAVQSVAVTDHCAGAFVQPVISPVVAVASPFVHTARIVRQRFVGHGFGSRAFLGGGLYGGFGVRGFRFR